MAPLHCSVELDKDKGVFFVKPHDTSSGTYVKLSEKASFELNQGDVLRLGDARLSVRKTEAWAVSGWLDSMLLKLALCLFKVEDGHRERLKPLGRRRVERFRAYRKRSGSATTRRWGSGGGGRGLVEECSLGSKCSRLSRGLVTSMNAVLLFQEAASWNYLRNPEPAV